MDDPIGDVARELAQKLLEQHGKDANEILQIAAEIVRRATNY